ncbi:transposase [Verrucomicrobiota bacterium]
MSRPLRIDVADGWYHITNRGIDRRRIYGDDRDRKHFLDLLGVMHERYAVRVHAYVLMTNHYHLLIQTPEANASRAIQWLNVSHSVWYNRRHQRVGPLFQGRFQSVLIEGEGAWVLEACFYVHLNPIRLRSLGLDKKGRRAEGRGVTTPSKEQVRERLAELRGYRWSSYRAYAGYGAKAKWLETGEIMRRSGGRERMRRDVEQYVKQGVKEEGVGALKARVVLGSEAFLESMRRRVRKVSKEQPDRKILDRFISWDRIVEVVEKVQGGKWDEFREVYGDVRRDLALYLARERSGLTLKDIGERAAGMDYKSVGKAIERFRCRLKKDGKLKAQTRRCLSEMSNVET